MFHLNDRLLEKLIDGSASGGEVTRIKRHAESCRACARRLEEWRDNYREVDEHFPDLAHEAGPAATVTPGGLVLLPTDDIQERNWAPDLTTLLWVAAVILALVVGYGASRLRQPNEGMAVATREGRGTPPAPQRRDGIAAGATAAPARDSSPAVALAPAPVAPATRNPAPSAARTRNDPPASTRTPPRTTPGPTERAATTPGPTTPSSATIPVSPRFRAVGSGEASLRLGGRLRLLDGLEPDHVEIGPASAVPGAQRGLDVVRVVYRAPDGGRILVDQQLIPADSSGFRPIDDPTLENGETAYGTSSTGVSVATWLDEEGYRISVVVQAPVDSLKRLVQRVQ